MQNVLRDRYEGEMRPNEGRFSKEQGYKEALEKSADYEDALISRRNEKTQDRYKKLGLGILERGL